MTIVKAAQALLDATEQVAVRPHHWRGEGIALVAHGGQLYRHAHGQPSPGAAYVLTLGDLVSQWEVVTLARIEAEANGTLPQQRRRHAPAFRAPGEPPAKKGRPTAAAVAVDHPGWHGVAEVAQALGISTDRVRRAVRAGLVPSKVVRGVILVRDSDCRQLTKPTLVTLSAPDSDARPTPDVEPEVW